MFNKMKLYLINLCNVLLITAVACTNFYNIIIEKLTYIIQIKKKKNILSIN